MKPSEWDKYMYINNWLSFAAGEFKMAATSNQL